MEVVSVNASVVASDSVGDIVDFDARQFGYTTVYASNDEWAAMLCVLEQCERPHDLAVRFSGAFCALHNASWQLAREQQFEAQLVMDVLSALCALVEEPADDAALLTLFPNVHRRLHAMIDSETLAMISALATRSAPIDAELRDSIVRAAQLLGGISSGRGFLSYEDCVEVANAALSTGVTQSLFHAVLTYQAFVRNLADLCQCIPLSSALVPPLCCAAVAAE